MGCYACVTCEKVEAYPGEKLDNIEHPEVGDMETWRESLELFIVESLLQRQRRSF